jgi:hypothetical protein
VHALPKADCRAFIIHSDCAIYFPAITRARASRATQVLEDLNLQSNGITDAGAGLLAEALNLTSSLKKLDLWGNHIRHRGALAIAESIAATHDETPIQLLRVDEAWLPVQKLFGKNPEDQARCACACAAVLLALPCTRLPVASWVVRGGWLHCQPQHPCRVIGR